MRQITAAEVKPGMEVQFDLSGWDVKGTVATVDVRPHAVWIYTEKWCEMSLDLDSPVTVLSEPQPEEPTEFGARVIMDGRRFLRVPLHSGDSTPWLSQLDGRWRGWDDLCEMGPVTVIPDQGWTAPAERTPEVPKRLCVWPENDEHLRGHKWRDNEGDTIQYIDGAWRYLWSFGLGYAHTTPPECAPWTRRDG